jgi:hypothetical protein
MRVERNAAIDGRADFDFLFGSWRVLNRRLADPLAEGGEWQEFESSVVTRPILGGLGNFDLYAAPSFPGRPWFEAVALRLFDPEHELWRLWWASTIGGGLLDPPVTGRFDQRRGEFEGDDVFAGQPVRVRTNYWNENEKAPASARWQQAFSFDAGESFETNWTMQWTRLT